MCSCVDIYLPHQCCRLHVSLVRHCKYNPLRPIWSESITTMRCEVWGMGCVCCNTVYTILLFCHQVMSVRSYISPCSRIHPQSTATCNWTTQTWDKSIDHYSHTLTSDCSGNGCRVVSVDVMCLIIHFDIEIVNFLRGLLTDWPHCPPLQLITNTNTDLPASIKSSSLVQSMDKEILYFSWEMWSIY